MAFIVYSYRNSFTNLLKFFSIVIFSLTCISNTFNATPQFANFVMHSTPKSLENLTFRTADGRQEDLENFKGKLCILVFWATWCSHCLPEMKDFEHLAKSLQEKNFQILAVSQDTKAGSVEEFYNKQKIQHLPIYYDTDMQAALAVGIRGLPTVILIDKQGREIGRLEGAAAWGSPQAEEFLQYYLEQN